MILFFDTETTGKYDFRMPPDHPSQPHLVQLAAMLTDDDGKERAAFHVIVCPDIPIPDEAAAVHGITTEAARMYGFDPVKAIVPFLDFWERASLVVGHNVEFDQLVMGRGLSPLRLRQGCDAAQENLLHDAQGDADMSDPARQPAPSRRL